MKKNRARDSAPVANIQEPSRGRPTADQAAGINHRILNAAWQVLLETGPENFSIDRVAVAAQASKRTIYARFPGKIPLLQAVLDQRIGLMFTGMRELADKPDPQDAFADQARRAVLSMISPESRLLERVVDLIDANLSGGEASPTRAMIHDRASALIREQLRTAAARWNFAIDDVESAAGFWLDGLFGHAGGLPSYELQKEEWATRYARYFLRAVAIFPKGREHAR